eukprot:3466560-Rhodomonas_salina.1
MGAGVVSEVACGAHVARCGEQSRPSVAWVDNLVAYRNGRCVMRIDVCCGAWKKGVCVMETIAENELDFCVDVRHGSGGKRRGGCLAYIMDSDGLLGRKRCRLAGAQ